jgi:hypothetical protein
MGFERRLAAAGGGGQASDRPRRRAMTVAVHEAADRSAA